MDPEELAADLLEQAGPAPLSRVDGRAGPGALPELVDDFDGKAEPSGRGAVDGPELLKRVRSLPGFGEMKADLHRPARQAGRLAAQRLGAGLAPYSEPGSTRSVADIVDAESLEQGPSLQGQQRSRAARGQLVTELADRRLYLCTPDRQDLAGFVAAVIDGGVDIVQLRDKALEAPAPRWPSGAGQAVCEGRGVPFILNDRPDLALELGADGVHVGQDDRPRLALRRLLGPDAIVGLSTHARPSSRLAATRRRATFRRAGGRHAHQARPARHRAGLRRGGAPPLAGAGLRDRWGHAGHGRAGRRLGVRHFVVVRDLTEAADPFAAARRLRSAIDERPGLLAHPVQPADEGGDGPGVRAQPVAGPLDDPKSAPAFRRLDEARAAATGTMGSSEPWMIMSRRRWSQAGAPRGSRPAGRPPAPRGRGAGHRPRRRQRTRALGSAGPVRTRLRGRPVRPPRRRPGRARRPPPCGGASAPPKPKPTRTSVPRVPPGSR